MKILTKLNLKKSELTKYVEQASPMIKEVETLEAKAKALINLLKQSNSTLVKVNSIEGQAQSQEILIKSYLENINKMNEFLQSEIKVLKAKKNQSKDALSTSSMDALFKERRNIAKINFDLTNKLQAKESYISSMKQKKDSTKRYTYIQGLQEESIGKEQKKVKEKFLIAELSKLKEMKRQLEIKIEKEKVNSGFKFNLISHRFEEKIEIHIDTLYSDNDSSDSDDSEDDQMPDIDIEAMISSKKVKFVDDLDSFGDEATSNDSSALELKDLKNKLTNINSTNKEMLAAIGKFKTYETDLKRKVNQLNHQGMLLMSR